MKFLTVAFSAALVLSGASLAFAGDPEAARP